MPHDEEWVRLWLAKAEHDLAAAEKLAESSPIFPEIICFHAQQAVEKYLKAFLVYHNVEFEKVHAIRYLLDLCGVIDASFENLREMAEPLTVYAVIGRYPMAGPVITSKDSDAAIAVSKDVRAFVLSRLPENIITEE